MLLQPSIQLPDHLYQSSRHTVGTYKYKVENVKNDIDRISERLIAESELKCRRRNSKCAENKNSNENKYDGQWTCDKGTICLFPFMLCTHHTAQYSTVQYSTVQYSTVQHSTIQYSTAQSNIQNRTVHSTQHGQHNTRHINIQHST